MVETAYLLKAILNALLMALMLIIKIRLPRVAENLLIKILIIGLLTYPMGFLLTKQPMHLVKKWLALTGGNLMVSLNP